MASTGIVDGGHTYIRRPRVNTDGYTPLQIASAYNYPAATGKGYKGGIIELGGGFGEADLTAYFGNLGLPVPTVVSKPVAGGSNTSDGPNGADGEVLLDIEVAGSIAPGATFNVYFAPNTDSGFDAAIAAAITDGCHAISISWGGPENSWASATIKKMEATFAKAQAAGIQVFAASGDSGSSDGTSGNVVDYPASSPSVCGCGGTRLMVDSAGQRTSEVVWDDDPASSASGGGVSALFPGRDVPDIAANADPETGYLVTVDGQNAVFGGTSAVAPLHLGLYLRLLELTGKPFDFVATVAANATVCFDVTSGTNGGFRAGPGRDEATGFGVPDGTRLLAVLQGGGTTTPVPVPTPTPVPVPTPTPVPAPPGTNDPADDTLASALMDWAFERHTGPNRRAAKAVQVWLEDEGYLG